MRAIFKVIV